MSKTEVSGKQVKDGTIELVDLSSAVSDTIAAKAEATDVTALDTRVTAVESGVSALQSASAPNLSDLGEVAITTPSSGQVLKYDGLGWVNAADSTFSGAYADLSGKPTLVSALDDLSDVTISSPSTDQVLKYDGTAWVNAAAPAAGASDLDGLSDVVITSAAKGHFIAHNGTNFVNTRTIQADVAATVIMTLKGAASQSANLFEVQNSSSQILNKIGSDGSVSMYDSAGANGYTVSNSTGNEKHTLAVQKAFQITQPGAYGTATTFSIGADDTVDEKGKWQIRYGTSGSSGTFVNFRPGYQDSSRFGGVGIMVPDDMYVKARLHVHNVSFPTQGNYGDFTGLLIQNYDNQSGTNAFEIQNHSNVKQFAINKQGQVQAVSAATKALVVKGAASQTANMFELQNSAGTAFVSVNGNFGTSLKSSAATTASLTITPGASAFAEGNAAALVINRNDGAAALIVDAMGGVLAFNKTNARLSNYIIDGYGPNIFNSDSGSLNLRAVATKKINFVTPDEGYSARTMSFYHGASLGDGFATGKWYQDCNNLSMSVLTTGFGINVPIGTALGAQLHLINGAAARKGVVIRGHASQSANLLEVQNGSGAVLVQVNSTGRVGIGDTGGSSIAAIRNTQSNAVNTLVVASDVAGDVGTAALVVVKKDNNTTTGQSLIQFLTNAGVSGQGQIVANGSTQAAFASYSDARLKENVIDLPSQLNSICSLRPVEFDYKDGSGHQIGFIAQEVQEVYPDLVNENNEGILTLTGLGKNESRLIKALQELSAKVDALQAEKEALEARIAALENN
jgi:hypothetical protein